MKKIFFLKLDKRFFRSISQPNIIISTSFLSFKSNVKKEIKKHQQIKIKIKKCNYSSSESNKSLHDFEILWSEGKVKKSFEVLEKRIQEEPTNFEFLYIMTDMCLATEQWEKGKQHAERALELGFQDKNKTTKLKLWSAIFNEKMGLLEDAKRDYHKVINQGKN